MPLKESIIFHKVPKNVGVYPLINTDPFKDNGEVGATLSTSADDGHIAEDEYILAEGLFNSVLEISDIDLESGDISGKFNMVLAIDPNYPKVNPTNPDTNIIKNVMFTNKIVR